MYPMIDAVSGLLGDGVLGTFEDTSNQITPWILKNGKATIGQQLGSAPEPQAQVGNDAPVAVLIGPSTASAGEFTAMSFKGRLNTRFFGAPSAGYVTANQPVPMPDGAVIVMTTGWGVDRMGKRYSDRLVPDEDTGAGGSALDAAITWLSTQKCTASR